MKYAQTPDTDPQSSLMSEMIHLTREEYEQRYPEPLSWRIGTWIKRQLCNRGWHQYVNAPYWKVEGGRVNMDRVPDGFDWVCKTCGERL